MNKSLNLVLFFFMSKITCLQYGKWKAGKCSFIFISISKNKLDMNLIAIGTSYMPGCHTHVLTCHSYATSVWFCPFYGWVNAATGGLAEDLSLCMSVKYLGLSSPLPRILPFKLNGSPFKDHFLEGTISVVHCKNKTTTKPQMV